MPATDRTTPLRFAIIGGGVSGLAAAHRLHQLLPQAEVRVFEASGRLGGPLHTLHAGEAIREQGADSFLAKTPWAVDLCRELGLGDQLVPTNSQHRRALVVRDGRLLPVPAGFVLMRAHKLAAVLRSPVLSLRGRLRLLAEPLRGVPVKVNHPNYDESVASFATRRLGREAFERLVEPLMAGIYVADAAKLSLAATMPEFLEAERRYGSLWRSVRAERKGRPTRPADEASASGAIREPAPSTAARYGAFLTLRGGMASLVRALAASLPPDAVETNAPVRSMAQGPGAQWLLNVDDDAVAQSFDGVILATPAPRTAELAASFDPQLAELVGRIEYASSAVVTLVYERDRVASPLDGFGFVVPTVENRPIIAGSFPGVKFPHSSPAGFAPVRVFFGGAHRPELVDRDDRELAALAHSELRARLGVSGEPLETHVARWRQSMPQYHVGHVSLVDSIQERAAVHRGLALAGNGYRGVGIPQCIQSGRLAAERIASFAQRPG